MLELLGVNKSYPGVQALKNVGIEVHENEVVGLVGENGAGKSTLMRILSGVNTPDSGSYRINGENVTLRSPRDAEAHGIGMMFQEQSLLPNLTVGENIYLGQEQSFTRFGLIRWSKLREAARRQLEKVQSAIDPDRRTSELNFAQRQMVELAKVLTLEEQTHKHLVILLDEPTSVLERADIEILFDRVKSLKARASFIFVSHRLDEVLHLSDRIYVMKDGAVVAEMATEEADVHKLHQLMVGRGLHSQYYRESRQKPFGEEIVLAAKELTVDGAFRDVTFDLHTGEVIGIAGVIGSGREQLTRTLFGFVRPSGGEFRVANEPVRFANPADAVQHGIGYIPRERRTEGLVLFLAVAANMTLASLSKVMWHGLLNLGAERRLARDWVKRLSIRTPSISALCLNLSGGNQQKVVLSKWLSAGSRIVILDHPTRGLDVGAKEEIYEMVRDLSDRGVSIIITADTIEETIGLSHTILVMRDGLVTRRFAAPPGNKPQQIDLIEYMV